MGFTVAITGRPNVGKSTFFNRLLEQRKAIVEDTPGVTRDRQYGIAEWNGKTLKVFITGGLVPISKVIFEGELRKKWQMVLDKEKAWFLMVVAETGIKTWNNA